MNTVEVIDEVYQTARGHAQADMDSVDAHKFDNRMIGGLQMLNLQDAENEIKRYAILYKVKQSKSYKENGLTWQEFLDEAGLKRRMVDQNLSDLSPFFSRYYSLTQSLIGMDFTKFRQISRAVGKNEVEFRDEKFLVIGDEEVPVNDPEAIASAFENYKKQQADAIAEKDKETRKLKKRLTDVRDEGNRTLKAERDALLEENQRMRAMLPDDTLMTRGWDDERLTSLTDAVALVVAAATRLINADDQELEHDLPRLGKITGLLNMVERGVIEVRQNFESRFTMDYED